MSVLEPDAFTLCDEDQYYSLQYAVKIFNKENPELRIQRRDLLRCGELNFISLNFNCRENLRLEVLDDRRKIEKEIGNYAYGGMVEILEYAHGTDLAEDYTFTAHKVRPLNLHLLKPKCITSPKVKSEFLSAPYYFVPNIWPKNELDPDDITPGYDDSTEMTSELMLAKSDLPKVKFAVEKLMQQVETTPTMQTGAQIFEEPQHSNKAPWEIADPKDPKPEQPWYIPARYFARQLIKHNPSLEEKLELLAKKIIPLLTDAGFNKRGGKKPLMSGTILKALSNVLLK